MLRQLRTLAPYRPDNNLKTEGPINQFCQPASCRPNRIQSVLVVLVLAIIVQFSGTLNSSAQDTTAKSFQLAENDGQVPQDTGQPDIKLPKNVTEMRDALLAAARSAKIDELRTPYAWNELPPAISKDKIDDPIAYWKRISRDGQGLEILMILDKLLALPPAKLNVGKDYENSALYVWPYLSELDLTKLTPRQQFELRTLLPPHEAKKIMASRKWTWWRLAIGADGTWHSFMKHDR